MSESTQQFTMALEKLMKASDASDTSFIASPVFTAKAAETSFGTKESVVNAVQL
jgi:hypothetical protein